MENELRRFVDALPGLVWTAFPDGHIDFLNRRWCEYTGLSADEGHGQGWQTALHPADLPELLEQWRFTLTSGEPHEIEARLRRFDGEYRWFLISSNPMRDEAGQVVKWCGVNTDIEDRRRAEESLRLGELSFSLIVDSIPAPVAVTTPSGEVEGVNRPTLEYFGKTFEELKDWTTSDVIHPDDLQRTVAAQREAHETGSAYNVESRHRRADGIYRWFNVRGFPLRDARGRILRWFHLQIDVDDRKRAEEELRRSEARKTAILDSAIDCIVTIDHEGRITEFNPAAERTFGYRRDKVVGKEMADVIIPPSFREQHRRGLARYLAMGDARVLGKRIEMTAVRADGSEFPVELAITRIPTDGPPSFTGYLRDITRRKQSEEELRRTAAFLAEAQRLSSTGSFSWRVATDEITWSEELYRVFEFDQGAPVTLELIGTRVHPEDLPVFKEHVEHARSDGSDMEFDFRLQLPDRSVRYMHVVAHSSREESGQREYIGAVQDVTERRLSEEALGQVRSELAHVARVTSLGALTASIAHEVNQPLSGIITNANTCLRMLAADPPNVDGARETAQRTIRDGYRASDVITRLRALFSKKNATTESVDLNEATREVIVLSRSELQRSQVISRVELADQLPPVSGDRVQLQQVILNLLLNAAEAMSGVNDRPRQLVIRTARDEGDQVRLTVQDVGVGFAAQGVDKLFESFYTTKNGGMGIGLSVSRSIIESHHGRLWATPNDGPGATFSFSIPRGCERTTAPHTEDRCSPVSVDESGGAEARAGVS